MKSIFLAAALTLGLAGAAAAAPIGPVADVSIAIGPELQAKADVYGQRELDKLSDILRKDVTRALTRAGAMSPDGARLELVIAAATPNHPTFKQLGDHPGLSIDSFGIGGAKIEGQLVHPDGRAEAIHYSWYETDIRQVRPSYTWNDADYAFGAFAARLVAGKVFAER